MPIPSADSDARRPPTWTLLLVCEGSSRELVQDFQSLRAATCSIALIEGLRAETLLLQARVDLGLANDAPRPIRLEYQGKSALYVIEMVE